MDENEKCRNDILMVGLQSFKSAMEFFDRERDKFMQGIHEDDVTCVAIQLCRLEVLRDYSSSDEFDMKVIQLIKERNLIRDKE